MSGCWGPWLTNAISKHRLCRSPFADPLTFDLVSNIQTLKTTVRSNCAIGPLMLSVTNPSIRCFSMLAFTLLLTLSPFPFFCLLFFNLEMTLEPLPLKHTYFINSIFKRKAPSFLSVLSFFLLGGWSEIATLEDVAYRFLKNRKYVFSLSFLLSFIQLGV